MNKAQHGNARHMKMQSNVTLSKANNSLAIDSKDIKVDEMPDKEFKRIISKRSMNSKKIQENN
jgi:hypothetical protein